MLPSSRLSKNSVTDGNSLAFEYVVGFDQVFVSSDSQAMDACDRRRSLLSSL
jgi:hypothetical protein